MRLVKATIEGYRSVNESVEFYLDRSVTVVLGPNDHGKTNILDALRHLNREVKFGAEDLNWDRESERASLPSLRFELEFTDQEREELRELERLSREAKEVESILADAKGRLTETAKAVSSSSTAAERARRAVKQAEGALETARTTASETRSAEDGTALEAAEARLSAAQTELAAIEATQDTSEERAAAAGRVAAVAQARAIELHAALGDQPVESAVAHALKEAQTNATAARDAVKSAKAKLDSNNAAAATILEEHGDDSNEHQTAVKAVTSASAAHRAALRKESAARERLEAATQAAEATERRAEGTEEWMIQLPVPEPAPLAAVPTNVTVERNGEKADLQPIENGFGDAVQAQFVFRRLPRVEVIHPREKIPDYVTREALENEDSTFMRGIFHYAGIEQREWDRIFVQDYSTSKRLEEASRVLNDALRKSWSQGRRLTFALAHQSKSKRIELRINDPAVKNRFVQASRRSSGFTHFFALKTILHALQKEAPASSYLWVFDEPGVFLHPDGQHDLVQVMETLAKSNQVVYSTHSIFMANKNFPARHRLVVKTEGGTTIDGKPYRTRWRPAIEALGMSLPGTLLFATKVLLVEGDSDSILVNATLQKLIALGKFDHDVNALSVMATGDPPDASALVRMLTESAVAPKIAAVFDGDEGGEKRERALGDFEVTVKRLTQDTTTEDHIPAALELYPRALAVYLAKMSPRRHSDGRRLTADEFYDEIVSHVSDLHVANGLTKGLATWSRTVGAAVGQLSDKPSPVGVAREYQILLQDTPEDMLPAQAIRRGRELAGWISQQLALPSLTLSEDEILQLEGTLADALA
jgi:predicted ATP-dependent endonuclease of OLD family